MDSVTDKLDHYRQIIERILTEVAQTPSSSPDVQDKTFFDRQADRYAVISEGWNDDRRIHHILIHLEIINGKVWVQADRTDLDIARELERAGIPKSDIVLGFHPADVRPFTEYAPA
jgi:hypothetical protein